MVASVVKKNGMLATKQNIVIGWGMPAFIVLFNMCFEYDNYGGTYHCWLQMDKGIYHCIIITFIIELTIRDYPLLINFSWFCFHLHSKLKQNQ